MHILQICTEDINEKLDNLSKNVNSVTINSNAQASRAKRNLIEAQDNFDRGKYCEAYAGFKKYTGFEPDSCVGYEGMYKVILKLKGNTSKEKDKYAGYDLLNKMISCKDCDKRSCTNTYDAAICRRKNWKQKVVI